MNANPMAVLLVGETPRHSLYLLRWLSERKARCKLARTLRNAHDMIPFKHFDLVLSDYQLPDRTAFPLLSWLEGSSATLLFSTRIEDGCIWLKMLERGRTCIGAPLLRSHDLPNELDILVSEMIGSPRTTLLEPVDSNAVSRS